MSLPEVTEVLFLRTLARLARLCKGIDQGVETWRCLCVRYPHALMEKQFHHHLDWPIGDGWLGTPPHPRLPPLHHPRGDDGVIGQWGNSHERVCGFNPSLYLVGAMEEWGWIGDNSLGERGTD